jgi:hypothetical protein
MAPWAAHFPNAVIRPFPSGLEELEQGLRNIFALVLWGLDSCLTALEKSVRHLSKNIELKLAIRGIASSYRR